MTSTTTAVNPAYLESLERMTPAEAQAEVIRLKAEIDKILKARALYQVGHWPSAPYWTEMEREMVKSRNWEYFLSASIAINRHWGSLLSMLWAAQDRSAEIA